MTLRARRWYYSFAILVFLITAPLIVATASGWRWGGWNRGFLSTGTMVVTASPRAEVTLNGQAVGTTPKRLNGLTPGIYRLGVRRVGYTPWDQLVKISAQTTTAIGPVQLFRTPLVDSPISPGTYDRWFVDATQTNVAGWRASELGGQLDLLWPRQQLAIAVLPSEPAWFALSPRQQHVAVGLAEETRILALDETSEPWSLPAGEQIEWMSSSDNIFYRLEGGQLVAYDELARSRASIEPASSFAVTGESLWLTVASDDLTEVRQRFNAPAAASVWLTSLDHQWLIVGQTSRAIFLAQDGEGVLVGLNRLTGRVQAQPLNGLTSTPASQPDDRPVWFNGIDVMTLNDDRQPTLLLRPSRSLRQAAWIDPGHILATLDTDQLTIRSVSSRQGRGVLLATTWPTGSTPLLLDAERQSALVVVDGKLRRLSWH